MALSATTLAQLLKEASEPVDYGEDNNGNPIVPTEQQAEDDKDAAILRMAEAIVDHINDEAVVENAAKIDELVGVVNGITTSLVGWVPVPLDGGLVLKSLVTANIATIKIISPVPTSDKIL